LRMYCPTNKNHLLHAYKDKRIDIIRTLNRLFVKITGNNKDLKDIIKKIIRKFE